MLRQLYIKNYALFRETRIDFPRGLNILTGETGAGKSLLIGALGLIMGKRADNSFVFLHEEKCIVEAVFSRLSPNLMQILSRQDDFDLEENELYIRREIRPTGKSRAFINDTPVSLQTLREVSSLLLDMHGQHDNMVLLSAEKQLELLDQYGDNAPHLATYKQLLDQVEETSAKIAALVAKEETAKQQLEFLQYQLEELEKADVKANEEEELESELNLLQHSEEIREALGGAVEMLYHQDLSIYGQLGEVLAPLRKVGKVHAGLGETIEQLEDVLEKVKDATFSFQGMLDTMESDPARLSFIEDRLSVYHTLKLKYQVKSGAELVELYEAAVAQIQEFDSLEDQIAVLRTQQDQEKALLLAKGLEIEERRVAARPILSDKVTSLLTQVGFLKAQFGIDIQRNTQPTGWLALEGELIKPLQSGLNKVQFLIQTNPGVPAGPLSQIASGGEISRVMLALKAALAEKADFPVLIFDEIDTGISGEIAMKVGAVMQQLATRFQILSITHLPQIAAKGNQHFQIKKKVENEKTFSDVEALDHQARVQILAEMLSGNQPTASAMRNAEELIAHG